MLGSINAAQATFRKLVLNLHKELAKASRHTCGLGPVDELHHGGVCRVAAFLRAPGRSETSW